MDIQDEYSSESEEGSMFFENEYSAQMSDDVFSLDSSDSTSSSPATTLPMALREIPPTQPTLSVLLHNQTFNVKSINTENVTDNVASSDILHQLEYTSLEITIAPLMVTNIVALATFIGFFFASYSEEEKRQQDEWKNRDKGKIEIPKRTDTDKSPTSDSNVTLPKAEVSHLFDRWKKSSPFNLNVAIANSVILLSADPLDVFINIPLLDVSNRYLPPILPY